MMTNDEISDAIKKLTEALEADLFYGDKKTRAKHRLHKVTVKLLGYTMGERGDTYVKKDVDGNVIDRIHINNPGPLQFEPIETVMKQVTFDMKDLVLWPHIKSDET